MKVRKYESWNGTLKEGFPSMHLEIELWKVFISMNLEIKLGTNMEIKLKIEL